MKPKADTPNPRCVIARDTNAMAKLTAALALSCDIINRYIARLEAAGLLPNGVTPDAVEALNLADPTNLHSEADKAMTEQSKIFGSAFAQKLFSRSAETAKEQINAIFADLGREYAKHTLTLAPFTLGVTPNERTQFLRLIGERVTFDADAVAEYYTEYAAADMVNAFIAKARDLHAQIVEFDAEVHRMTNGALHGVVEATNDRNGIIEIADGIIYLDFSRLREIDFEAAADRLQTSTLKVENSKVIELPDSL